MFRKSFPTADEVALHTATFVLEYIRMKPSSVIVLTSGETPIKTYRKMVEISTPQDFQQVTFIGLDEWVGIGPDSPVSCRYIIENALLLPLKLPASQYTFFDGLSNNLEAECSRIDELIASKGGLDLVLLGIGLNGHLGLNEPGTNFDVYCHVPVLAEQTVTTAQKYFKGETKLEKGITIGLRHIVEAKCVIILATGEKKRQIITRLAGGEFGVELPASVLKVCQGQTYIWTDDAAYKFE